MEKFTADEISEVDLVNIQDLSQYIKEEKYKGFIEMQSEDFSLNEYSNPYSYLNDCCLDSIASVRYGH